MLCLLHKYAFKKYREKHIDLCKNYNDISETHMTITLIGSQSRDNKKYKQDMH